MGTSSPGRAHSVHSMVGTSYPLCRLRGCRSSNRRHSQCTYARLRQFRKVPVYLLPWRCPQKHHAPYIPIIHPLSFIFFCYFFLWMSTFVKKKKKGKKDFSSVNFVFSLQQTTFRAPFSKERSRRHWVSVWCKTACFGWNTLPPLCSGTVPPRDWSGDGVCFIRVLFVFFPLFFFCISLPLLRFSVIPL